MQTCTKIKKLYMGTKGEDKRGSMLVFIEFSGPQDPKLFYNRNNGLKNSKRFGYKFGLQKH